MTIKYVKDFEFPSDAGYTKSATSPRKMNRGGRTRALKNIRDEEARVIGVQDDAADELRRVRARRPKDAQERTDKRQQLARVGSRRRNATDELGRLRDEAEYEIKRGAMGAKKGGGKDDWIKGAVKKPGALREYMDVKEGENIPKGKIKRVADGKSATPGGPKPSAKTQKRARLAETFAGMKKSKGGSATMKKAKGMKKGGSQGYDDKLDESLGMTDGKESGKKQSYKDRRDESKGEEAALGRRAYASVDTMDKGNRDDALAGFKKMGTMKNSWG
tara:strand:+ start:14006 stop:14830 length:825 start_codon:yes stop_codon:yes gene_type:complete